MKDARIAPFLASYTKANTRRTYQAAIFDFLDGIYGRQRAGRQVNRAEKDKYVQKAEQYFKEDRNRFEDLMDYTIAQADRSPIPAKAKIAGVKEWLTFHDVEFSPKEIRQLRQKKPKGNTGRTAERDISVSMLKQILAHLDVKGKALVLVLASSGMRIGEATAVDLSDVNLESTPVTIVVRGETTKTGDQRTVFISTEAKEAVIEWLKVRGRYLEVAPRRNVGLIQLGKSGEKKAEDNRLFPFTAANARGMWNLALEKAGLLSIDRNTNQTQIKIHGLRKFFRSQLAITCPLDIVEALMGHEGYLTAAYRRFSLAQMGEYYQKAEHHVSVTGGANLKKINDELQDTKAKMDGYKTKADRQEGELAALRSQLDEQTKKIAEIGKFKGCVVVDQGPDKPLRALTQEELDILIPWDEILKKVENFAYKIVLDGRRRGGRGRPRKTDVKDVKA